VLNQAGPPVAVRWRPGQSGNPKGRPPKGVALTDLLRAKLDDIDPVTGRNLRELMVEKLSILALAGDLDAMKVILDRTDGKVPDLHTVDGKIHIALSWDDGSSE
jgi:hypothetical protein